MFAKVKHFLSLIRFSHTVFALPFALLAAMMAWRLTALERFGIAGYASADGPSVLFVNGAALDASFLYRTRFAWRWQELLGILLCMVSARSAAMAFNRLADQKIDAENPRTAARHLPAGILTAGQVTLFAAACSLAFVASTLFFLPNRLPLYLSLPVLLFLLGYSYAKRFTSLAHFWLGAALAMAPVAAWIALRGDAVLQRPADLLPPLVLGGAVLAWVAGFDVIYACQDHEFDRQANLRSVPVRWGVPGALRLAAACHFGTIVCLAALSIVYPPFGSIYALGVAAVAVLLMYEHAIVRPDDLERVNVAFFHVNAVISLGLLAVGILDLCLDVGA